MTTHRGAHAGASRAGTRVLVVGTDDWAIQQASTVLRDAGLTVVNCHPAGQPDFPCNALVAGRECPLDAGFDVVVTMRARPLDTPTPGEIGVVCGLHAGAALVTAGMGTHNPFESWATRAVGDDDDLVAVVRAVLADRSGDVDLTEAADTSITPPR